MKHPDYCAVVEHGSCRLLMAGPRITTDLVHQRVFDLTRTRFKRGCLCVCADCGAQWEEGGEYPRECKQP